MKISKILRQNNIKIPVCIGNLIAKIPCKYKPFLGTLYQTRKKEIQQYEQYSSVQKKEFIFERIKKIVTYAYYNVPFYKKYYDECEYDISSLKNFEDINKIPIINKSILLKYKIYQRTSQKVKNKYIVNTGGSSGHPLSFYIEPNSTAHEWAHMFTIWEKLGYKPSDIKIHFAGRGGIQNGIEYDFARNSYEVDMYIPFPKIKEDLLKIMKKGNGVFLHGYPSVLYEFALYCSNDEELKSLSEKKIKGIFMGSEYPYSHFRDVIERVFNTNTISWYGHTERCVLAYEKSSKYEYYPFQTYGYTEIGENGRLIGTSYYNMASPLIRYDTEDSASDFKYNDGILESFKLENGRAGQYITDKQGKNISLTGLIFGRHHKLFDFCSHIQISQNQNTKIATIYFVANEEISQPFDPRQYFDTKGIDIDFNFKQIKEPFRTPSGKINILIKENN